MNMNENGNMYAPSGRPFHHNVMNKRRTVSISRPMSISTTDRNTTIQTTNVSARANAKANLHAFDDRTSAVLEDVCVEDVNAYPHSMPSPTNVFRPRSSTSAFSSSGSHGSNVFSTSRGGERTIRHTISTGAPSVSGNESLAASSSRRRPVNKRSTSSSSHSLASSTGSASGPKDTSGSVPAPKMPKHAAPQQAHGQGYPHPHPPASAPAPATYDPNHPHAHPYPPYSHYPGHYPPYYNPYAPYGYPPVPPGAAAAAAAAPGGPHAHANPSGKPEAAASPPSKPKSNTPSPPPGHPASVAASAAAPHGHNPSHPPGYAWPHPPPPHMYPYYYPPPYYHPGHGHPSTSHPYPPTGAGASVGASAPEANVSTSAAVPQSSHSHKMSKKKEPKKAVSVLTSSTNNAPNKVLSNIAMPPLVQYPSSHESVKSAPTAVSSSVPLSLSVPTKTNSNTIPTGTATGAVAVAAIKAKSKPKKDKSKPLDAIQERRARKNAQSRYRANKLKELIDAIRAKDPKDRSEEECAKLTMYEERRLRKNGRSRDRALSRKREFDTISAKPEKDWTKEEKEFMESTLVAKYKKNEGDRVRRKRMRETSMESNRNRSTSIPSVKVSKPCAEASVSQSQPHYDRTASIAPSNQERGQGQGHGVSRSDEHAPVHSHSHVHSHLVPRGLSRDPNPYHREHGHSRTHNHVQAHAHNEHQYQHQHQQTVEPAPYEDSFTHAISKEEHDQICDEQFEPDLFDLNTADLRDDQGRDPMTHFIFPSSPRNERTYLNSPTLELCAETSILDHSSLGDIAYSPRVTDHASASAHANMTLTPIANSSNVNSHVHPSPGEMKPYLTSPMNMLPLHLPRRNKRSNNLYHMEDTFPREVGTGNVEDLSRQHEPIAVSFSMDTL